MVACEQAPRWGKRANDNLGERSEPSIDWERGRGAAVAKRKPGRKKKAAPVPQRSGVPYEPEFFSGFLFATAKVVSITAIVFFAFR